MRHKVSMVKLLVLSLSKELVNLETKLTVSGDAHANTKQKLEQLAIHKDVFAERLLKHMH